MNNAAEFNVLSATAQEIFDYTTRMVHQQGGPSTGYAGCAYRGEDGRRCAVGWLIPDEVYSPGMEGKTAKAVCEMLLATADESQLAAVFGHHLRLLTHMQNAHDSDLRAGGWERWFRRLRVIANSFSLKTDVLDQLDPRTA